MSKHYLLSTQGSMQGVPQGALLFVRYTESGNGYLHLARPNWREPQFSSPNSKGVVKGLPTGTDIVQYDRPSNSVYIPSNSRISSVAERQGWTFDEATRRFEKKAQGQTVKVSGVEMVLTDYPTAVETLNSYLQELGIKPEFTEPTISTKETTMHAIKIEKKFFINGREFSTYSNDELYNLIRSAQTRIDNLNSMPVKPARLQAEIESLQADLQGLVDFMNEQDAAK